MKRLLITILILCTAYAAVARNVTGVVRSGAQPLAGVVVSDGENFAVTDAKGAFKLKASDAAEFVYIATPSGYSAPIVDGVVKFYERLDKIGKKDKVVFELTRISDSDDFVVFTVADPQTGNRRHMNRFIKETEPDMQAVAKDYQAKGMTPVGLYLGDIAWDHLEFFDDYKKHTARLGFPVYQTIGNHDYDLKEIGDDATSREFRNNFGPLYYGFNLGNNYFIVTDNIVYDTGKKYEETWDETQLKWLEDYSRHIPAGSNVYIAMHAPFMKYFFKTYIDNGERVLKAFAQHKLNFLTGHTHINSNMEVAPGVREFNVASAGGAWWRFDISRDGTPNGYKVFELKGNDTSWYYKSTGHDASYQFHLYDRGNFIKKANAVVAKVWDWDEQWKVEWIQDGVPMGEMERFTDIDPDYERSLVAEVERYHAKGDLDYKYGTYRTALPAHFMFACVPDPYAKVIEVVVTDRFGRVFREKIVLEAVDVQAHRGGMGLMPENTIEAMLNAVRLGVNTLELDLQISKDGQVLVSHDPYMNYNFVTKPDGSFITKEDTKKYFLYNMTYDSIVKYDTGTKFFEAFPQQQKIATSKPLLNDLIDAVEKFTAENGYTPVNYNIEIKSHAGHEKNGLVPEYREFTDKAMAVLHQKGLGSRLIIQTFDVRGLNYLNEKYPGFVLSYLVGMKDTDFEANMAKLDFVPQWYSPHHSLVNESSLALWHEAGLKVVPWTVDDPAEIERLVNLKVDAIIGNYPDRILKITRKY